MTIQFNCPDCDALIAFKSSHCGKRAKCTACGQTFIIPSKDYQKPEKVPDESDITEPIPSFYKALFGDSWKIFINPANAVGLIFVIAIVCLKFFTGHIDYSLTMGAFRVQLPIGLIISITVWGCLFWCYIEIICTTAFGQDELPEIDMGDIFGFVWNIIKSVYTFAVTLLIVQIPTIISIMIFAKPDIEPSLICHLLSIAGLCLFPIAILVAAVGCETIKVFRPDYLFTPVIKAPLPYITITALFLLTWQLEMITPGYGEISNAAPIAVTLHLLANIAVQFLVIIAMRGIGLFHRHYCCYFIHY